jgi:trehalose 6-phosphate synthase
VIAIATHEPTVPTEEFGQGHDFVVVANRSPVTRTDSGEWETSPGGLVAAVRPVMAGRRAAWVGWDGTYEPSHGAFQHDGMTLRSVPLSAEEKSLYYDGCCNGMFWPLYHDAIRPPEYRRDWWHSYVRVNRRFAAEAAAMLAPGGVVWVHDYQLQLVPQMLRQLRPDARIGFFLHIPFPPRELYMQLPWRREIMQGLLGADLIGLPIARLWRDRSVAVDGRSPCARRCLSHQHRYPPHRAAGRSDRCGPARRLVAPPTRQPPHRDAGR